MEVNWQLDIYYVTMEWSTNVVNPMATLLFFVINIILGDSFTFTTWLERAKCPKSLRFTPKIKWKKTNLHFSCAQFHSFPIYAIVVGWGCGKLRYVDSWKKSAETKGGSGPDSVLNKLHAKFRCGNESSLVLNSSRRNMFRPGLTDHMWIRDVYWV